MARADGGLALAVQYVEGAISSVLMAVGTALSGGPPHRSQRAELPHWAPASGTNVEAHLGIGVQDASRGKPSSGEALHPLPGEAVALAAAPERL